MNVVDSTIQEIMTFVVLVLGILFIVMAILVGLAIIVLIVYMVGALLTDPKGSWAVIHRAVVAVVKWSLNVLLFLFLLLCALAITWMISTAFGWMPPIVMTSWGGGEAPDPYWELHLLNGAIFLVVFYVLGNLLGILSSLVKRVFGKGLFGRNTDQRE